MAGCDNAAQGAGRWLPVGLEGVPQQQELGARNLVLRDLLAANASWRNPRTSAGTKAGRSLRWQPTPAARRRHRRQPEPACLGREQRRAQGQATARLAGKTGRDRAHHL